MVLHSMVMEPSSHASLVLSLAALASPGTASKLALSGYVVCLVDLECQ
jgi:hypothetical protein